MMKKVLSMLIVTFCASLMATSAMAIVYADKVTNIQRGDTTIGNFEGYYGGSYPGAYPIELAVDEAMSAVLGAPDTNFLSLPGDTDTPSGTGFLYAYVEVAFSGKFDADSDLIITELGNNNESAHLWIWTLDGSNVQPVITRNVLDTITIDLKPYEAFMLAHGGAFDRVGIGGLDLLGSSYGFDLDAVAVSDLAPVPEPATMLLIGSGMLLFAGFRKKIKI
ncbi:PEP-CTERM sorting domain-containing protein [archaeon]|nr:PEP-CTERM sorting domain-containing protein [archaeon]